MATLASLVALRRRDMTLVPAITTGAVGLRRAEVTTSFL